MVPDESTMARLNGGLGSSSKTSDDLVGVAELSGSDTDEELEDAHNTGSDRDSDNSDLDSVLSEAYLGIAHIEMPYAKMALGAIYMTNLRSIRIEYNRRIY